MSLTWVCEKGHVNVIPKINIVPQAMRGFNNPVSGDKARMKCPECGSFCITDPITREPAATVSLNAPIIQE